MYIVHVKIKQRISILHIDESMWGNVLSLMVMTVAGFSMGDANKRRIDAGIVTAEPSTCSMHYIDARSSTNGFWVENVELAFAINK